MKPIHQPQISNLITEIQTAFKNVSRENGISLNEAWVIDDYGDEEERAEARANDTDTEWQQVPDDDIYFAHVCLSYFDPIAFRYYLPAYMIWILKNYDQTDSLTPESTLRHLTLTDQKFHQWATDRRQELGLLPGPEYSKVQKWELDRFQIFSKEQSESIAHFLQFIAKYQDNKDAQKALDRYWQKFNTLE